MPYMLNTMSHMDKEFIDLLAGQDLSGVEGYDEADLRITEAALDPRLYTAVVDEYSIRVASLFIDKDDENANEQNRRDETSSSELMHSLCEDLKAKYNLDDAQMMRAVEACRLKFQPGTAIHD